MIGISAFDATIRVGEASVHALEDENGKTYEAQLVLGVMAVAPAGPQQIIPIPLGLLRVPLNKDSITSLIDELSAVNLKMESRPDIQVATNLSQVEHAAKLQQGLIK